MQPLQNPSLTPQQINQLQNKYQMIQHHIANNPNINKAEFQSQLTQIQLLLSSATNSPQSQQQQMQHQLQQQQMQQQQLQQQQLQQQQMQQQQLHQMQMQHPFQQQRQ
ncbi:unnamed protein product [[Candida] boidinii]|uniref:Unnamed protein product n=1 Tax=Candida boidinii TaxID=5477 RepID=A0ACB5TZH8_CANBO|nr:unnamed protein product [[Candida] boidinii]